MSSALDLLSFAALAHAHAEDPRIDPSLEQAPVPPAQATAAPPVFPSIPAPVRDELDGDDTEEEDLPSPGQVKREAVPTPAPARLALPASHDSLPQLPAFATFLPAASSLQLIISAAALPSLPMLDSFPLPPLPAVSTRAVPHRVPEDSGIIRCVCTFTSDDGFTIQCDGCNAWLHASCVSIHPDEVPEEYLCGICDPYAAAQRGVDPKRAEEGQRRRVHEEDLKTQDEERAKAAASSASTRDNSAGLEARPPIKPKPRRSLTTEDRDLPSPSTPSSFSTDPPTAGPSNGGMSVVRDPVVRKRGRGKQTGTPSNNGPGRPRAATLTSALSLADFGLDSPRLSSLGALRGNYDRTPAPATLSDDDDAGDDRYETWQYEFTPVQRDLWSDTRLIERLEIVLADLVSGAESPTKTLLKELWDRQAGSRARLGDEAKLLEVAPLELDALPEPVVTAIRPLANLSFHLIPPVAASYTPTSTQASQCPYPRPTVHALFSTVPIAAGTFISQLRGQIISLETYRSDHVNQYSMLGVPKQGVRFLPQPWSLAIDSRKFGNEVRFARSGCHPNAIVRAIKVRAEEVAEDAVNVHAPWADQRRKGEAPTKILFAIYALVDIGRKEEIVLPWDWDDDHIVHALPSLMNARSLPFNLDVPDLEPLSRKMSSVTTTILGTTSCACDKKRDCALFWMCRAAGATSTSAKTATAKREPFATILLNALSTGVGKEEEKGARGKKKPKKPDVGELLGLERGWIKKLEIELPVELPMAVEVEIPAEVIRVAMEVDEVPEPDVAMDVDEPEPQPPVVVAKSPKKTARPPTIEDPDSDSSDLTEPLPHQSDDDLPTKAVGSSDEEDIVRPPPRRRLLASKKTSTKEVGPSRKKLKEREVEEKKRAKLGEKGLKGESAKKPKVKVKVKTVVRELDAREIREKEAREDEAELKEKRKNAKLAGADAVRPGDRKRSATYSTSTRPAKIAVPARDDRLRFSRSPSPTNPPTAPSRIESGRGFDFGPLRPVLDSTPSFVLSSIPPPPYIPPEPPAPVVEPEIVPPPIEIVAPPPPPRARLSLAEYRQRQAQKPAAPPAVVPPSEPEPPKPVLELDIPPSSLLTVPDARSATTTPYVSRFSPALPTPSPVSPAVTPRPLSSNTEAMLKSIGDYFAREQPPPATPTPATPLPVAAPRPALVLTPVVTPSPLPEAPAVVRHVTMSPEGAPPAQDPSADMSRYPPGWSRTSVPAPTTALGLDASLPAQPTYGRQLGYGDPSLSLSDGIHPSRMPPSSHSPPLSAAAIFKTPYPAASYASNSSNATPLLSPTSTSRSLASPGVRQYESPFPTGPRGLPGSPPTRPTRFSSDRPAGEREWAATQASPYGSNYGTERVSPVSNVSPYNQYAKLPDTTRDHRFPAPSTLPSGPRGFSSSGSNGPSTNGGNNAPSSTPTNGWSQGPVGNANNFRGTMSNRGGVGGGGRFDNGNALPPHLALSPSQKPVIPAPANRYDGVPRGPAAMTGGPPPSGPRHLPGDRSYSDRGGDWGRGGGIKSRGGNGWRGRGRGRGM